jgi:hypothetical protein
VANDSRLGTDRERIPESLVSRVLARAVELDTERSTSIPVTELRSAALEAGFSAQSIDQALAELDTALPAGRRARWKERARLSLLALLVAGLAGASALMARGKAVPIPAGMLEERILLRCLETGDVAELVRPLLDLSSNRIVVSTQAPRVLTITATRDQLERVRSTVHRYESTHAGTCAK